MSTQMKPGTPVTPTSTPKTSVTAPTAATKLEPKASANAEPVDEWLLGQVKEELKQAILKGNFEIPMLPHVAQQVLQKMNDPKMGFPELEVLVKQDQALAAKVIKTANSPFYRGAQEITQLSVAMGRMGMKTMKDIIVSLGIQSKAFSVPGFESILDRVWDHSVACAGIAQMLAKQFGIDSESAFLAGLLHDIGKPIIVQICSRVEQKEALSKKLSPADAKKFRLAGLREDVLPTAFREYHEVVGGSVAKRWNLSELVVNVVRHHHSYAEAPDQYRKICTVVYLANVLCHHCGLGHAEEPRNLLEEKAFQVFNLSEDRIQNIAEDAPGVAHKLMGFM